MITVNSENIGVSIAFDSTEDMKKFAYKLLEEALKLEIEEKVNGKV
jgi:hypothetical protein